MKINDLFESQLDEGPIWDKVKQGAAAGVRGVSKLGGAAAGVAHGAWDAAKQGYQAGRAAVGNPTPGGQTPPPQSAGAPESNAPTQQASAPGGSAAPATTQQSQPAAGQESEEFRKEVIGWVDQLNQKVTDLETQLGQANQASAPETPAAPATTPAAPTGNAPLTKAQQDAKKAELLGKRAAGKSVATSTGGGFSNYVQGGGGERIVGADAQGNVVTKKNVAREGAYQFESKFLGGWI